jgi:hypothetical protein
MTLPHKPAAKPDLRARILKVLGDAGRPLTRGELQIHGSRFSGASAAEIQAALDVLAGCGLVAVGHEWDERFHREYVTYERKRKEPT